MSGGQWFVIGFIAGALFVLPWLPLRYRAGRQEGWWRGMQDCRAMDDARASGEPYVMVDGP